MIISVINHTNGEISDLEVQRVIRVVNQQISQDFEPYWSMGARLRLEGKSSKKPDVENPKDMRGDAVIYLWNSSNIEDALGFHDRNFDGIPYGFVFTKLSKKLNEPWSVTFSHEALELIADPEVNLLVQGPHPEEDRYVFHWYEMCDAVQADYYDIDGVKVSNFVLPLYFTDDEEPGSRNDFMGVGVKSFGTSEGGYIGFYDPDCDDHVTWSDDPKAKSRLKIKGNAKLGRRSQRYQMRHGGRHVPTRRAFSEKTR